jgi:phosphoglycolate phosphatase
MNIFFDLDGTLINSKERLYKLFQYLVPLSDLSFEDYWELKKSKVNHREILKNRFNYSESMIKTFENIWLSEIEKEQWLALDHPFENISDLLKELSKKNKLFIVTARQSETAVYHQIKSYGWNNIPMNLLVTEQKVEKYDLIKKSTDIFPDDYIIGDTGKDIQAGKLLGIKTVAVLSGFLNKDSLKAYQPDFIINFASEFIDILNGKIQK